MAFEGLVGNEKVKELLQKTITSNKTVNSYLFIGIEGIGKKLFAKEFAKMLLCLEEEKPCRKCKSCIELANDNHPDFYFLSSEGVIKIEEVRALQTKIAEKPIISNRKVYIIDNSEQMTKEAQNCLLKTLEEPPEYSIIILITANENLILNTIKSRCTKIYFQKIEDIVLENILREKEGMENISKSMLQTFGGSIGRAIQLKEKTALYQEIEQGLKRMENANLISIWNQSDVFYNKDEIFGILDYMNVYYYDLLKKSTNDKIKYANCIGWIEKAKKNLKANSNFDMTIDYLLMKIWEEGNS